jgi:lysophospholipase L1-like esterase
MHILYSRGPEIHSAHPTPKLRIGLAALLTLLVVGVTGCDKLGGADNSPTAPSGPPASGSTIIYSALGASDVLGIGSSRPCSLFDDCDGTGYVWVAARSLRSQRYTVNVFNLGIPTTVISKTFEDLGNQNGRFTAGNIIDREVPFVRTDATLVTVFAGPNDVNTITAALGNGAAGTDPSGYIDQKVATFGADYATLVAGVRARAPDARIVLLNIPNLAGTPYLASASLSQKQAAQRASVRMTAAINALRGVSVIDLMCDPRLYQAATFSSDGFHPSDAGYAILGAEISRAMTATSYPAPRSSCPQMTLF